MSVPKMTTNPMRGRVLSFTYFIVDNNMNSFVEIKCRSITPIPPIIIPHPTITDEVHLSNNSFEYKL
jgi:hypothetical protein